MAYNRPTYGNQQVQKRQSRGQYMTFNRHRSGLCVAIVLAHNRPTCGNQHVQKWQSRGAYMAAVNTHIHGNQQAHRWQSTCTYMTVNRHIHGNQQVHTWQSTGTYMAVNRHIRSSHTNMVHMWQLFRHTKGGETVVNTNAYNYIGICNRMVMTHSSRTQNMKRRE